MMLQTIEMWPNRVKVEADTGIRMGGFYALNLTFRDDSDCKIVVHCSPSLFWYNPELCREMMKVYDEGEKWFEEQSEKDDGEEKKGGFRFAIG